MPALLLILRCFCLSCVRRFAHVPIESSAFTSPPRNMRHRRLTLKTGWSLPSPTEPPSQRPKPPRGSAEKLSCVHALSSFQRPKAAAKPRKTRFLQRSPPTHHPLSQIVPSALFGEPYELTTAFPLLSTVCFANTSITRGAKPGDLQAATMFQTENIA